MYFRSPMRAVLPLLVFLTACANEVDFAGGVSEGAAPTTADAVANPDPAPIPAPVPAAEPMPVPEVQMVTVEREFPAARIDTLSVAYSPEYRRASQQVTFAELPPAAQTFTQITRTAGTDTFKQGKDGQTFGPESFSVSNSGKLDLLIVVDNSTSMADEQTNLATKLDPLLSKIGNTDWQIAVVTSSSPCLRNNGQPIRKGDANVNQLFQAAVIVPLDNTVVEKGFPMAIKALKGECNGVTAPWIRAGSSIGVLILSDEDNCGSHTGEGCPGEQGETTQQMLDFLTGTNGLRAPGSARIYGLIDGNDTCGASAFPAPKYKAGIDATGGTWGRICDANYSTTLQSISDNVSRIVKREFTLTHAPDNGTLNVLVDGANPAGGYTVNGNVLTLTNADANAITLAVSYSYGSVPKHDRFALAMAADEDTLAVKINGVTEDPAKYTYDDTTHSIVFMNLPVDDATIVATYRKDDPLPVRFPLVGTDLLGAPLKVEVGGVETANYTFDAAGKAIDLATPPGDGVPVRVTHRTLSGRVTRYATALMDPSDAHALTATDVATSDMLGVSLAQSDLVFAAADVVAGRMVDVKYELGYDPDDLQIILGQEPMGDVTVTAANDTNACDDVSVVGTTVSFSCPDVDVGEVTLSYKAAVERFTAFTIEEQIPDAATWKVYVDGQETTDFVRSGTTVTLSGALAPTSVVTVAATFAQ